MFRSPAAKLARSAFAPAAKSSSKRCLNTFTHQTARQELQTRQQVFRQGRHGQNHGHGRRHFSSNESFWTRSKQLYARHPYQVSLAAAVIVFASGCIVYANYLYQTYIIASFHKYPEPVAAKLRRALYFTNTDLQPKEALKYYKQALEVANELGMDPFSEEIIGVKIQVAALMENIMNYNKAIEVLEILKRDCLQWEELLGGLERNKEKRTRVLKTTIAVSIKLGELYSNDYIRDTKAAEERLVWAVETTLREKQRRDAEGVKAEDEGEWMTNDEIGASMEALAHNYEEQQKYYLATPLFLQALSLQPRHDCHTVVLMNNLSISIAQQNPPPGFASPAVTPADAITPSTTSPTPTAATPTRQQLQANATQWAEKALAVAADIRPPVRDEECDFGCAVALHNLGEFAEMRRDMNEARKKYKEAVAVARGVGFEEGVENSSEALRRVSKA